MLISDYRDPLEGWMYLERYVNEGSDHKFKHQSDVPSHYRPATAPATLRLFNLLAETAKNDAHLPKHFFPVHPFTAQLYTELGHVLEETEYHAVPTSSTRTMLASNDEFATSLFVKLDIPVKISRFDRSIHSSDIHYSLEINKEVRRLKTQSEYFYGSLMESGGGHLVLRDGREAGYISRPTVPRWITQAPKAYALIPSFSLISQDSKHPEHKPLLIQIIENQANPGEYLLEKIFKPFFEYWFFLADHGLIWELQQQNTLFAFHPETFEPLGTVSRDFDAVYIDAVRRRELGKSTEFTKHVLEPGDSRTIRYSLVFDHRVCKQNILRIIQCFEKYYGAEAAATLKEQTIDFIMEKMPVHVREALPKERWFTVPEKLFNDGIAIIQQADPPLRR